jgi:hypothetical protein
VIAMFNLWKKKEKRDPDDFTPPPGLSLVEQEKFFRKLLKDPDSNYAFYYLQPSVRVMSPEEWHKMCEKWRDDRKRDAVTWRKTKIRISVLILLLIVIAYMIWC